MALFPPFFPSTSLILCFVQGATGPTRAAGRRRARTAQVRDVAGHPRAGGQAGRGRGAACAQQSQQAKDHCTGTGTGTGTDQGGKATTGRVPGRRGGLCGHGAAASATDVRGTQEAVHDADRGSRRGRASAQGGLARRGRRRCKEKYCLVNFCAYLTWNALAPLQVVESMWQALAVGSFVTTFATSLKLDKKLDHDV